MRRTGLLKEWSRKLASYWPIAYGLKPGDAGRRRPKTMQNLAQNMAWLLKKLA